MTLGTATAGAARSGAVAHESQRWSTAARVLFILAAVGSFTSPPLANIAAGLALIAYGAIPGAWPRLRAAASRPLGRGILILLATLAVATLWADPAPWARRFASWWSWRPLLLTLVGSALFDEPLWRDRLARALVALLALAALASFALRFMPNPVLIDEPGILLRNHTTQGMAFVAGVALAGMLAWGRPVSPRGRWLLIGAIALFLLNIATVTSGRSAHVALLVTAAVGAFCLVRGRGRWLALLLVPLLGAGLLASSSLVRDRFEKAVSELGTVSTAPEATSMGIRVYIWSTTRELIERRPLLGYGVGGFAPAYAALIRQHEIDSANWRDASRATDTHNEYLHILVEAGLPGLLAFLVFVTGALRQPAPAPYRGCGLALLCAWLTTSLLNSHFQTFAEAHLLGLVLGGLLGSETRPYRDTAGKTAGGAAAGGGAASSEAASAATSS